jgi:hypothetical protein
LTNDLNENDKSNISRKLITCKSKLEEIEEQIKEERAGQLEFIRTSIEQETKQGFYDLAVAEQFNHIEADWSSLKQKLLSLVDSCNQNLKKIQRVEEKMKEIESWLKRQTRVELPRVCLESNIQLKPSNDFKSIDSLIDNRTNLCQLNEFKCDIENLCDEYRSEKNCLHSFFNENTFNSCANRLAKEYIVEKLLELQSQLNNVEKMIYLQIESELNLVGQSYMCRISELNTNLDKDINNLNTGRLESHKHYESSIIRIKQTLNKLKSIKENTQSILNKIDITRLKQATSSIDQLATGLLDNLNNNHVENAAIKHIECAESDLLRLWSQHDEIVEALQFKLDDSTRLLSNFLNCININETSISEHDQEPLNNCEIAVKDCTDLIHNLSTLSKSLAQRIFFNKFARMHIEHTLVALEDKYKHLTVLFNKVNETHEESLRERSKYEKIIDSTCELMQYASKLISNSTSSTLATIRSSLEATNSPRNAKTASCSFLPGPVKLSNQEELENCELKLQTALVNLKALNDNINDRNLITKISELICPLSQMIVKMREYRLNTLNCVEESNQMVKSKISEIEFYLNSYVNKRNEELKLNDNEQSICSNYGGLYLDKIVTAVKYMISNEFDLSKYQSLIEELYKRVDTFESNLVDKLAYLKEKIAHLRDQITLTIAKDGLFDSLVLLDEINKEICDSINKKDELGFIKLIKRLDGCKLAIKQNCELIKKNKLEYIEYELIRIYCIQPLESALANITKKIDSSENDSRRQFEHLASKLTASLNDMENILAVFSTTEIASAAITWANYLSFVDSLEKQFYQLRSKKLLLTSSAFKEEMELLKKVNNELKPNTLVDACQASLLYEKVKLKYLDVVLKIDDRMKLIECELDGWKRLLAYVRKLRDTISYVNKALSSITMNNIKVHLKEKKIMSQLSDRVEEIGFVSELDATNIDEESDREFHSSINYFNANDTFDLIDKLEFQNNKIINRMISKLKADVIARLNDNERTKSELIELKSKMLSNCTNSTGALLIRDLVDNVLHDWQLVDSKAHLKLAKYENFKKRLGELELSLKRISEELIKWEDYLMYDCMRNADLSSYHFVLNKKLELESHLNYLTSKDSNVKLIFSMCLHTNNTYLQSNENNRLLISRLKKRWISLNKRILEKISYIQNLWSLLCDLNDQLESFQLTLTKSENFYKNTMLTCANNPRTTIRLIEDVYETIKDDYKLIKYLNESYISFGKLSSGYAFYKHLDDIKQRLIAINARWDHLHNQIAMQIKCVSIVNFSIRYLRKYSSKIYIK